MSVSVVSCFLNFVRPVSKMTSQELETSQENDNIFKIMLATDIHLGYLEQDPIRGDDSFNTFEEILQIAEKEEVDFVLLGGDLFHETKPTPYCIYKCTELLRKYCLGDKPVAIEFMSDQAVNFKHTANPVVNYEDPNINVSIPVFSIHGNHDDPTGQKHISAMDLMANTGLINYFGRWNELEEINIKPILLRKGETQLALYGLSHIRDERLGRLFLDNKVTMDAPFDDDGWFNLLVLHQNRAMRSQKNYIPVEVLPDFLDLVIWGHEHDCKIIPEKLTVGKEIYVSQPGSSVATSLSEGEALKKHCGLLRIKGKQFQITPIELKTVRPFIFEKFELPSDMMEGKGLDAADKAMRQVKNEVDIRIVEAQGLGRVAGMLPLIRIIVMYHQELQVFNAIRFGHDYSLKVANPDRLIKFEPIRNNPARKHTKKIHLINDEDGESENLARVEDIILQRFSEGRKLDVLSVKGMNEAVTKFILANDTDAPVYLIEMQAKKLIEKIASMAPDEEDVDDCITVIREQRQNSNKEIDEIHAILNDPKRSKLPDVDLITLDSDDEDHATNGKGPTPPARGPGSRGGKGSRGGRGGRGSRGGREKKAEAAALF